MFRFFKNDLWWKKIMKITVISSCSGVLHFWFLLIILISNISNWNNNNVDKSFYIILFLVFKSVFISYSLSIYIVNSNEIQQQKYRFLWLFLFIIAINPIGFISILLLMHHQKQQNNTIPEKDSNSQLMIKTERYFLLWVLYSTIMMMIFIVTIPILIINLINIKNNWKKTLIDKSTLKTISYFSHDIFLINAVKFAV